MSSFFEIPPPKDRRPFVLAPDCELPRPLLLSSQSGEGHLAADNLGLERSWPVAGLTLSAGSAHIFDSIHINDPWSRSGFSAR